MTLASLLDPATAVDRPGWRRRMTAAAAMTALVVSAFEGTVVTGAMPTIARSLGHLALYPWVFVAFLVGAAVAVPSFGRLADRHGRRPAFTLGMALFLGGSVLCGAATSMPALIAARVLQGLGAGALGPLVATILADVYTLEERAKVQALFTGAWGVANAIGPILGGLIVSHWSWRAVFWINVPFGLMAVGLLRFAYVDPRRTNEETGAPIDLGGAVLFAAAASTLLLAMERDLAVGLAGRAAMIALALVLAQLLWLRMRHAVAPLFPVASLAHPTVRASVVGSLFAGALMYAPPAYVPLWMATERHESPLLAGASLVPLLVGWAVGSTVGVRALLRHGALVTSMRGVGLATAASVAFVLTSRAASYVPSFVMLAFLGLGLGFAANTLQLGAQNSVGWKERAAVTGMIHVARTFGGSIAVALLALVPSAFGSVGAARMLALALASATGVVAIAAAGGVRPAVAFRPAAREAERTL